MNNTFRRGFATMATTLSAIKKSNKVVCIGRNYA